jgi:mono/diheme cytochrome c family protein
MSKPTHKHRILALGLVAALAWHGAAQAQSSDNVYYTQATLATANGEQIFRSICQGCHMPDGKGATGAGTYPALAGDPRLVSAQYMAAVVMHGRRDMPAFVKKGQVDFRHDAMLTDAQIAGVINYVRSHFGNHYTDTLTAADVAAMPH